MIIIDTSQSVADLEGILALQKKNLPGHLTPDEIRSQGFVTVDHSFDQLKRLNDIEKHIIARDGHNIVGYVLAMTQESQKEIPVLVPMFLAFNDTFYRGKIIADYNYIVIGQVCVDKSYRGQGIFDQCYQAYKERYRHKYDFAITEIARSNTRSLNAHKRVGFKEISNYSSPDNKEWTIVLWNWETER